VVDLDVCMYAPRGRRGQSAREGKEGARKERANERFDGFGSEIPINFTVPLRRGRVFNSRWHPSKKTSKERKGEGIGDAGRWGRERDEEVSSRLHRRPVSLPFVSLQREQPPSNFFSSTSLGECAQHVCRSIGSCCSRTALDSPLAMRASLPKAVDLLPSPRFRCLPLTSSGEKI